MDVAHPSAYNEYDHSLGMRGGSAGSPGNSPGGISMDLIPRMQARVYGQGQGHPAQAYTRRAGKEEAEEESEEESDRGSSAENTQGGEGAKRQKRAEPASLPSGGVPMAAGTTTNRRHVAGSVVKTSAAAAVQMMMMSPPRPGAKRAGL
jgi:hypothetical protein